VPAALAAAWQTVRLRDHDAEPGQVAATMAPLLRDLGPATLARGVTALLGALATCLIEVPALGSTPTGITTGEHEHPGAGQVLSRVVDGLTGPGAVARPAGAPTALGAAAAALLGHDPTAWLDQRGPTPALELDALTEVLGLLVEHLDTHHARPFHRRTPRTAARRRRPTLSNARSAKGITAGHLLLPLASRDTSVPTGHTRWPGRFPPISADACRATATCTPAVMLPARAPDRTHQLVLTAAWAATCR